MKSGKEKVIGKLAQLRTDSSGSIVVFDEAAFQRVLRLIEKFQLTPPEAQALRQDIADLAAIFDQEVTAILASLEEVSAT